MSPNQSNSIFLALRRPACLSWRLTLQRTFRNREEEEQSGKHLGRVLLDVLVGVKPDYTDLSHMSSRCATPIKHAAQQLSLQ